MILNIKKFWQCKPLSKQGAGNCKRIYSYPFISLLLDRPKLGEWWARIEERPSFKEAGIVKEPIGLSTLAKKLCTIL